MTPNSFPPKYWAHHSGLIDLHPSDALLFASDQLVDRALIAEAFIRFGIGHDEGRLDVVLSCYTDDVVVENSNGGGAPFSTRRGRREVERQLEPNLPRTHGQRRHFFSNICIERLTAGEASAIAYGIVTNAADGLRLKATVLYKAELRKCDDGFWRFSYFRVGMDDYLEEEADAIHRELTAGSSSA